MTFYQSWKDVPKDKWRWKNFSPREVACKGTGSLRVDEVALDKLQELRETVDAPLLITSAYRSPEHTRKVGGAKGSYHLRGCAFDVRMENQDPVAFEYAAREVGFRGIGYYPKQGFMHIDLGPERTWGTPFKRMAADKATMAYVAPNPDIDALRASAAVARADFCNGLADIGLLTDDEAVAAAKGAWPASLDGFLTYLDPKQARDAQIEWASCATVERLHSFVMALGWWMGMTDEAVDALFGIAAPVAARKTREK